MDYRTQSPLDLRLEQVIDPRSIPQNRQIPLNLGGQTVNIRLPEPLESGKTYCYQGLGQVSPQGQRGNLYLTIRLLGAPPVPPVPPVRPAPPAKKKSAAPLIIGIVAAALVAVIALVCVGKLILPKLIGDNAIDEPSMEIDSAQDDDLPAVENQPLDHAHDWTPANYMYPETCYICGQTRGLPLGLAVGDTIVLGSYEQDSYPDGADPIEWTVLEMQGQYVMVISTKCIECLPYNNTDTGVTWETCSLRQWLNGQFYANAFTDEERAAIALAEVQTNSSTMYSTPGGDTTYDYLFLLSQQEAEWYLSLEGISASCEVTDFALSKGAGSLGVSEYWWTRTPGIKSAYTLVVDTKDGKVFTHGDSVDCLDNTVRPVMWLDLSVLEVE